MRWFWLDPRAGVSPDGTYPVADALEGVSEGLVANGARKAILIVEDADGVTIAVGRAPGINDTAKDTADLLLRVALDAKELVD